MSRLDSIALVKQEDENGCLHACLAMVTRQTYADVVGAFPRMEHPKERGLHWYAVMDFLSSHGFGFQYLQQYRWFGAQKQREEWPLPLSADATICFVDGGRGGEYTHGIVALRDGTVFDPHHGMRRWSDYQTIGLMLPLFDLNKGRISDA